MTRSTHLAAATAALLMLLAAPAAAQQAEGLAAPTPPAQPAPQPVVVQQPVYAPAPMMAGTPYQPRYVPRQERRIVAYRNEMRSRPEFWGTGLALFGLGYVLDFAILTPLANAISDDRDAADEEDAWAWSLLPFAGPVIQLAIGAPHPAIPIVTGLMQMSGLVMFIYGLADQQQVRVPIHEGDPDDPSIPTLGFDAAPLPGGGQLTVNLRHL